MYAAAQFDTDAILEALEREGVTHTTTVSSIVHALVNSPNPQKRRSPPTLKNVIVGGSLLTNWVS